MTTKTSKRKKPEIANIHNDFPAWHEKTTKKEEKDWIKFVANMKKSKRIGEQEALPDASGPGTRRLPKSIIVRCPYCGVGLPIEKRYCKDCGNKW